MGLFIDLIHMHLFDDTRKRQKDAFLPHVKNQKIIGPENPICETNIEASILMSFAIFYMLSKRLLLNRNQTICVCVHAGR